jgi:hypothetical protein
MGRGSRAGDTARGPGGVPVAVFGNTGCQARRVRGVDVRRPTSAAVTNAVEGTERWPRSVAPMVPRLGRPQVVRTGGALRLLVASSADTRNAAGPATPVEGEPVGGPGSARGRVSSAWPCGQAPSRLAGPRFLLPRPRMTTARSDAPEGRAQGPPFPPRVTPWFRCPARGSGPWRARLGAAPARGLLGETVAQRGRRLGCRARLHR